MSRFGVFWLPWLTTAASGSCRLKSAAAIDAEDVLVGHHAGDSSRLRSAAAIDAEDVPVAHHADESSRLRSARIC